MKSTLQKTWSLFTASEKRKALWMLGLSVLKALTEMLGVLSIMPFLSVLSRPAVIHEQPMLHALYTQLEFGSERTFIVALGAASICVVLVSSAFKSIAQYLLSRFVQMQRYSISRRLLSVYLRQPYEFFLSRNSAAISKNVLSEVDQVIANLINPISQLVSHGIMVLAMGFLIVAYDPKTAVIVLLVITVLYGGIYTLLRRRLGRIGKESVAANRERYQACNEAFGGIRDIRITHAHEAYQQRYNHAARTYARHAASNETLGQAPTYIVEAIGYTGLILLALSLLFRSNDIAQVFPALGLYAFATYRLLPAAQVMYRSFARLRFSSAALDGIYHDLHLPVLQLPVTQARLVPQQEIRLRDISFAYPADPERPVLDGYNLSIPANSSTGISGKSGAGKSTLMDILLGLVTPQSGTLEIDGRVIEAGNIREWQNAIGYVPQYIYLADDSVTANIAFGVPKESVDMQAVERAAKAAQIHEFIVNDLTSAYETFIGERGIRLSGGQRQRIGIARALYRDPPVLFMDEATSALDAQTEEAVNEAIRSLSGQKTIVVIAHKEASLKFCQQVVVVGKQ